MSASVTDATPIAEHGSRARREWVRRVAVGLSCLAVGVCLSHVVEPGVHVAHLELGGHIPALRFSTDGSDSHPTVLLAHGVTASKETMFRLGEALAVAGFTCYAVDLPGHGESPDSFRREEIVPAVIAAANGIAPVDVFVGHSMGAYAGAEAVRRGQLKPRLFMALGARVDVAETGPSLLLLLGRFDELITLDAVRHTVVTISPWSDHALEPYDPVLVEAAVASACAVHGLPAPASPERWLWRLLGLLLALAGALLAGDALPHWWPGLARWRGSILALLVLSVVSAGGGTWLGTLPVTRRVPYQMVAAALVWAVLWGAGKLRISRLALVLLPALASLVGACTGAHLLALIGALCTVLCLAAAALGWLAARGATSVQGDLTCAIFVGYALGQWMPLMV